MDPDQSPRGRVWGEVDTRVCLSALCGPWEQGCMGTWPSRNVYETQIPRGPVLRAAGGGVPPRPWERGEVSRCGE